MGCRNPLSDRSFQMAQMSPLRRRMIEDMTIRNLSPATQQSYVHAVSKFSQYFGRSPDRLGLEDVRAYQVHLASKGVMEGDGAYGRHSRIPAAGGGMAIPMLEDAARRIAWEAGDRPIVIADYGSSDGKNSLAPMS